MRSDAARNRDLVVAAARELFASRGVDVGVEEIARCAGVGKGTLYRRFPTKDHLLWAVVEDLVDELIAIAERSAGAADAGEGLRTFLLEAAEVQLRNHAFFDAMAGRIEDSPHLAEHQRRILDAITPLLDAAQAAGAVRADLRPEDVPPLVKLVGTATRPMAGWQDDSWRRYAHLVLDGLRPGAPPLPGEPFRPPGC